MTKRKNTIDLIVMGFICLVFCVMAIWLSTNVVPTSLNEQEDFLLEPIKVNP